MKKKVAVFLACMIIFSGITVLGSGVTVYAPDGRTAVVPAEEVSAYLALGWYGTYEETVQTLYAPDGRQITVYFAEVPAYTALGWYESYEETVQTLYAPDGRQITVYLSEVEWYCSQGWYESYENTLATVYASDGRYMQVYKADVPAYLVLGWYESYAETVTTMYAPDGRSMVVYHAEVPTYQALGWYDTYEATVQTLYAPGDRSMVVFKSEVPTYLALGWSTSPVSGPAVALTFDDGPHGTYTNSILDTLSQYGVKATFFTLGSQAAAYPSVVQRAHSLGHEIGSHSYSHPDLNGCSATKIQNEISSTVSVLRTATGAGPTVFRPPYGNHNSTVRGAAGVPLILWNVDTLDWKSKNASAVTSHVLSHASDGDVILMHDIYGSTAEAVKSIVPALLERGFRLVTVSELAKEKGVSLNAGTVYYSF